MAAHKVCIYKEYDSVCPLVGIGTLQSPLSPESVPLPPERGGGGAHSPGGEGWGSPNSDDLRKRLALCLLCVAAATKSPEPEFLNFKESIPYK